MARISPGEVWQCRLVVAFAPQISVNVLHYLCFSSTGLGALDTDLATIIDTNFQGPMKALLSSAATYRGAGARRLIPTLTVEATSAAFSGLGTVAGDPLPKQCAGMITKRTATPGRHGRGRMYVPFPGETDSAGTGAPTAGYGTRLATLGAQLLVSPTVGNAPNQSVMIPQIFQRPAGPPRELLSIIAKAFWATQRRRGDFGRSNLVPF